MPPPSAAAESSGRAWRPSYVCKPTSTFKPVSSPLLAKNVALVMEAGGWAPNPEAELIYSLKDLNDNIRSITPSQLYGDATARKDEFFDMALFLVAHTLAILQTEYEMQHNDMHIGNVLLVPVDKADYAGATLNWSAGSKVRYRWGRYMYEFRAPLVVLKLIDFGMSSARVNNTIIEAKRPNMLPKFEPLSDLRRFWNGARRFNFSAVTKDRMQKIVKGEVAFDADKLDPWEQYRVAAGAEDEASEVPIVASLEGEWFPEMQLGRNNGWRDLETLDSETLKAMQERLTQLGNLDKQKLQRYIMEAKIREAAEARQKQS